MADVSELPREIRAVIIAVSSQATAPRKERVTLDEVVGGTCHDLSMSQPVLIRPYDADDPPPEGWEIGTRMRCEENGRERTVHSEIFRDGDGFWCFMADEDCRVYYCEDFEPIPTESHLTLKVTASPEEIEEIERSDGIGLRLRCDGRRVEWNATARVEIVTDEGGEDGD